MTKWSEYEESILIKKYPYMTSKRLELYFSRSPICENRTYLAIEAKAKRLKINKEFSEFHYSLKEFSDMTGANISTLQDHIYKGKLYTERLRNGDFGIPMEGSEPLIEKYKREYNFDLSEYVDTKTFAKTTGFDNTTIRLAFKHLKPVTVLRKKYIHKDKLNKVISYLEKTGNVKINWRKALNDSICEPSLLFREVQRRI